MNRCSMVLPAGFADRRDLFVCTSCNAMMIDAAPIVNSSSGWGIATFHNRQNCLTDDERLTATKIAQFLKRRHPILPRNKKGERDFIPLAESAVAIPGVPIRTRIRQSISRHLT